MSGSNVIYVTTLLHDCDVLSMQQQMAESIREATNGLGSLCNVVPLGIRISNVRYRFQAPKGRFGSTIPPAGTLASLSTLVAIQAGKPDLIADWNHAEGFDVDRGQIVGPVVTKTNLEPVSAMSSVTRPTSSTSVETSLRIL